MPAGASPRREREAKQLEGKFRKEHRYPGRENEVAARIVNKQRAQYGETKGEQHKDKAGESPDLDLPIKDYQKLTIVQIGQQLQSLSEAETRQLRMYETQHKNRKGVLTRLDKALNNA